MEQIVYFFNELPSNPWAWTIMALMTITALVLAYRSTPKKVLKYVVVNDELITNNKSTFSELSVLYNEKPVERFTVSKITFWNGSFPTIKKEDLIDLAPFVISVNDGEILKVSILNGDKSPNGIEISCINDITAKIVFDYLERKEGAIIQILHTGQVNSIKVSKKIKGGKITSSIIQKHKVKSMILWFIGLINFFIWIILASRFVDNSIIQNFCGALMALGWFPSIFMSLFEDDFIPKNCRESSIFKIINKFKPKNKNQ